MSPAEIDRRVAEALHRGESLYQIDEELVLGLRPDLILTQNLCQVCAPSGNEAAQLMKRLPSSTRVVYLSPQTLSDVWSNILEVARAAGREEAGLEQVRRIEARIEAIRTRASKLARKNVFFVEWIDPLYCAGHWIPEMIEIAGGRDPLGRPGIDSGKISWADVASADPDVLVISPCGYHLSGTLEMLAGWSQRPEINRLRAFREGHVFALDADAYFVRPGPRLADGIEILAHIVHPEEFAAPLLPAAFQKVFQPLPL